MTGEDAAFAWAAAQMLAMSLSVGAAAYLESRVGRGHRQSPRASNGRVDAGLIGLFGVGLLAFWLLLTLLTWAVVRCLGSHTAFTSLFGILVRSALPALFLWLTYPLRNLGRPAYHLWQAGSAALLLGSAALAWIGLRSADGANWWQTTVEALPFTALIWASGLAVALESPSTFVACSRWRRVQGAHVVVYAPRSSPHEELDEIARGSDAMMEQAVRALDVESLGFRVCIFLFSDEQTHQRCVYGKAEKARASGYAHDDSISLVYGAWGSIRGIVAHELCHVLRKHRIAADLHGLLDEGLSRYVEHRLAPHSRDWPPHIAVSTSLRTLARHDVFFEWLHTDEPEYPSHAYYAHAHCLARYLIGRYGITKYKDVCRKACDQEVKDVGERFAKAVQEVYETTLSRLEQQWRQEWSRAFSPGDRPERAPGDRTFE